MAEEFRVLRPREFHKQLVSKGQRADGRGLEDIREIKLETDAIRTADSSSLVKLGNTSLVCGCIAQLLDGCTNNDNEDELIKITVSLPPICSNLSVASRFQHTSQLLTRNINNILQDSSCVDKEAFYVQNKESHWSVDVEVICLNYDGCLIDAALIAIISALKSLTLSSKSRQDIPDTSIKFNTIPICSSFAVIGNRIICDPNLEEETVAQSTFSITTNLSDGRLCQVNKVGGMALSPENLMKCVRLARERAIKIQKIIG